MLGQSRAVYFLSGIPEHDNQKIILVATNLGSYYEPEEPVVCREQMYLLVYLCICKHSCSIQYHACRSYHVCIAMFVPNEAMWILLPDLQHIQNNPVSYRLDVTSCEAGFHRFDRFRGRQEASIMGLLIVAAAQYQADPPSMEMLSPDLSWIITIFPCPCTSSKQGASTMRM